MSKMSHTGWARNTTTSGITLEEDFLDKTKGISPQSPSLPQQNQASIQYKLNMNLKRVKNKDISKLRPPQDPLVPKQ